MSSTNKALKSLRGKKLKTQQEIANKMGISRQVYNYYENEATKCELNIIFKILNCLDATDEEFDEFFIALKQDYLSCKNQSKEKQEQEKEE